jgi:hypothetical protein
MFPIKRSSSSIWHEEFAHLHPRLPPGTLTELNAENLAAGDGMPCTLGNYRLIIEEGVFWGGKNIRENTRCIL